MRKRVKLANAAARSAHERWRIRCCDQTAFAVWYTYAYLNQRITNHHPTFDLFCDDADPKWCHEQVARNRCVRVDAIRFRRCPRCREDKPLSAFGRDNSRKSGIFPYCRACNAARVREYQRRQRAIVVRMAGEIGTPVNLDETGALFKDSDHE